MILTSNLETKLDRTVTPGHFLKEWAKIFLCDLIEKETEREQNEKKEMLVGMSKRK